MEPLAIPLLIAYLCNRACTISFSGLNDASANNPDPFNYLNSSASSDKIPLSEECGSIALINTIMLNLAPLG